MMKLKTLAMIMTILGSIPAIGQNTGSTGNIVLRIKSYENGFRENETLFAANAVLLIKNIETGDSILLKSKYGIFKTHLVIGQNYLVTVSKEGYESKSITVNTTGAKPRYKYLLRFDFYLQQSGHAEYSHNKPVVCVVHNRLHYRFDVADCADKS